MSPGGTRFDFRWLVRVFADKLAELSGSDSVSAAVRRAQGARPDILLARGPVFQRTEVVEETFSFLTHDLLRSVGPLRVPGDRLPRSLMTLRAALARSGVPDLAAFPIRGEGELAGCVMAPCEGGSAVLEDSGPWAACESAVWTVRLGAATAALDALAGRPARGGVIADVDGVMTLDTSGRILMARGLCRDILTRAAAPPLGARMEDLLGGESASTMLASEEAEVVWSEHLLPASASGGLAVAMVPDSRGSAHRLGHRVVCVRDLRTDPGRRGIGLRFELVAEVAWALDALGAVDSPGQAPLADLVTEASRLLEAAAPSVSHPGVTSGDELNDIVRACLHAVDRALAAERIRVFSLLQPELPPAAIDSVSLYRALRRLIDRARASLGGRGGSLTLKTGKVDDQPYVTVSDDGAGRLANDGGDNIGLPLFRLAEPSSETDTIEVRAFLERIGAKLLLESRPGLWTRSTVLLRAVPARTLPEERPRGGTPDAGGPTVLSVLVVDDNPALRSVLRRYLERRGHEVTEASDGNEGLTAVAQKDFDRLIVDVHMPGKGGPEFYEGLGVSAPQLRPRTIFMTGGYVESAIERFIVESGRPALSKPFDLEELARAVEA